MAVIDLHAHLRMDVGVPAFFRGVPGEGPAHAVKEKTLLKNQLSLADLRRADVRLMFATVYAVPVVSQLRGGYLAELERQIAAVEAWAGAHPDVSLVRTPEDAEAVCRAKEYRLGLVLAVEGTHGILDEAALDRLQKLGVRAITIAHLSDSPWAGAAAVRYWPISDGNPYGKDKGKRNRRGLTELGKPMLAAAVRRGILIDMTHASDRAFEDVAVLYPELPLLSTHESARTITPNERSISEERLRHMAKAGGLVGLCFNAAFIGPGIPDVVRHAEAMARLAGPEALALGSDFNGFIARVAGVPNSAGYEKVLSALDAAGLSVARASAEAFVSVWRRALAMAETA